jgi:hypothetical protein
MRILLNSRKDIFQQSLTSDVLCPQGSDSLFQTKNGDPASVVMSRLMLAVRAAQVANMLSSTVGVGSCQQT